MPFENLKEKYLDLTERKRICGLSLSAGKGSSGIPALEWMLVSVSLHDSVTVSVSVHDSVSVYKSVSVSVLGSVSVRDSRCFSFSSWHCLGTLQPVF